MVLGTRDSVVAVANLLENKGRSFKVADWRGFQVDQDGLGCGGFKHWLRPADTLPDSG